MDKPLYDIQGKRITVGSLVAFSYAFELLKERVVDTRPGFYNLVMESGLHVPSMVCAVLEEPVWPNK